VAAAGQVLLWLTGPKPSSPPSRTRETSHGRWSPWPGSWRMRASPRGAGELADAAEALGRNTRRRLRTGRVAERAAKAQEAPIASGAARLPSLTGTPKQQKWAEDFRAAYVARRWHGEIPAQAWAHLSRFTEAHWWISYRDEFDCALGEEAGPLNGLVD
jgi:hypothetical protein